MGLDSLEFERSGLGPSHPKDMRITVDKSRERVRVEESETTTVVIIEPLTAVEKLSRDGALLILGAPNDE